MALEMASEVIHFLNEEARLHVKIELVKTRSDIFQKISISLIDRQ
jgi:hypothetical protein